MRTKNFKLTKSGLNRHLGQFSRGCGGARACALGAWE